MSRRRAKGQKKKPVLADLPLQGGGEAVGLWEDRETEAPADAGDLDQMLLDEADAPGADAQAPDTAPSHAPDTPFKTDHPAADHPDTGRRSRRVGPASRLAAGLADVAAQLLALGLAAFLSRRLGIPLRWDDWPPFLVLGLVFSFLYFFVPLAFWGRTPGMAWTGHDAQTLDGEPLTFGQTCLRWFGALLTLGLAGLPLLLAFGGRSLSDRLSDSQTVPR